MQYSIISYSNHAVHNIFMTYLFLMRSLYLCYIEEFLIYSLFAEYFYTQKKKTKTEVLNLVITLIDFGASLVVQMVKNVGGSPGKGNGYPF